MSLVARYFEENGLPTVIVGSALDIVEYCGVPRYVYSDFPLGNPCGPPWQRETQGAIVAAALSLLGSARAPRTTVRTPFQWPDQGDWRARYARVEPGERDRLLALGEERRRRRSNLD